MFGHCQPVVGQGFSRRPQCGILHTGPKVLRIGGVGGFGVASDEQLVGDGPPRIREVLVEPHGMAKGDQGFLDITQVRMGKAKLHMRLR